MKILASADLHGIRPTYDWLLAMAHELAVDAIVLAGDLLGCADGFDSPEAAQRHEATQLVNLLDAADVPVFFIMGNDDLVELTSDSERVQSIHGRRVPCGTSAFVGYQYSLPFMGGTFEKDDAEIAAELERLALLMDGQTVFVSHSPALGICDPGAGGARIGSAAIGDFLARHPFHAHIHGHSHGGFGRERNHFNVASGGRARAMTLDLLTMQHQVLEGNTVRASA